MNWNQVDREEQAIIDAEANGEMTPKEAREAMREMQEDIKAEAQEAADQAYMDSMGCW